LPFRLVSITAPWPAGASMAASTSRTYRFSSSVVRKLETLLKIPSDDCGEAAPAWRSRSACFPAACQPECPAS
jgi:hypothetical protein